MFTTFPASEVTLSVDTALSWDGSFHELPGDVFVEFTGDHGETALVHVSSRYTRPTDIESAIDIATDALEEWSSALVWTFVEFTPSVLS